MRIQLVDQDVTGGGWWSIHELPSGNVEVIIYQDLDGTRWEALQAAFNRYPDLPVLDSWFAEDQYEVVVLGYEDPGGWA